MLIHIYGNEKLIEKYWGGFDQKKGCGHSGHRTLKLAVSQVNNGINGIMESGLPVFPSFRLFGRFLGIVSLVFSEFWHGARNSYEVVSCA